MPGKLRLWCGPYARPTVALVGVTVALTTLCGCPVTPPDDSNRSLIFNNTSDRTNQGATYLGSSACMSCHASLAPDHRLHGHAHKLTRVTDGAPTFPEAADRAVGIEPPTGKTWSDIAYVIGGYIRKARFVDRNGYIMTTGVEGVDTQWNLSFLPNETKPGLVAYEADRSPDDPKPYDASCFVCHTTGPRSFDPDNPKFQDNREGMRGTFAEAGVQCEACHGPGSNHIPNPAARNIFVDLAGRVCTECHNRPFAAAGGTILAEGGFIRHHEQYQELKASGGHSQFTCLICHKPHVSVNYDRENAIRNECTACHRDQNVTTFHENKFFVLGDYAEPLGCVSCHMPYATKSATGVVRDITDADGNPLGSQARIGDMRTHIFRINSDDTDYTGMFSADGGQVALDEQGRAAVTLDFVCMRCHNGRGNAFALTVESAALIAENMHER